MRRLLCLALLAPAVFAVPALAQTTDSTSAAETCTEPDDGAVLTAASSTGDDGGVTAGPGGDTSGGTPAVWDGSSAEAGDASAAAGDASTTAADAGAVDPGAVVAAQEPQPQPEGPGQEQPGQPPLEPPGEAPAGEAPDTGGLPTTGLEALQLALLGFVLLLVGARLRVLALRRKRRAPDLAPELAPEPEYEEAPTAPMHAPDYAERDEWAFPDPSEPAPTGLLPSTASARRQARAVAMTGARE
jgi:hypothetical protein